MAFERFTDRARRVVIFAQEEARALHHPQVGTEHLLLGFLHEGGGGAATALRSLGLELNRTRAEVEQLNRRGDGMPRGHIPFTHRAKRVLDLSLREALMFGHTYLGTEHLLLGMLREGEGRGTQVLARLGHGPARVRELVVGVLSGGSTPPRARVDWSPAAAGPPPATGEPWPSEAAPTPLAESAPDGVAYEANRRRNARMGTEHVLLWLLSHPEGGALRALRAEGVEVASLRRRLDQMLAEAGDSSDP